MITTAKLVGELPDYMTDQFRLYLLGLSFLGYRRVRVAGGLLVFPYKSRVEETLMLAAEWSRIQPTDALYRDGSALRLALATGDDLSIRRLRTRLSRR
ncbi:MAG: hypothetical protein KDB68_02080 [Planctomycetes bacterium]|nr:hypothetical protein [Planctomycetota bacterium]